ncbi:peroxidase family protein [Bradyrhizobium sp. STM 3562]|uniref:peroxidase family protein n=1 Tax=Bradyrhizobium sp. STM 3562 TaxID=578924 RepID=UPI00388D04AA
MAARSADASRRACSIARAGNITPSDAAPGFRHFLGNPQPSQRFRVFGIDPLNSPEHLPRVRALMNRLSRRMDAEIRWPAHADGSIARWENPSIPSGYTYLLQFVAHDLVHSTMPLSIVGELGSAVANARRAPLLLESLYGHGPVGSPHLYALDAPSDDRRTKLRLGRMRWKEANGQTGCPFRDIARTYAENLTGIERNVRGRAALTDTVLADARNDDHAIISQLTALLATLHNGLVDLARRGEPVSEANGRFAAAFKRFLCARDALIAIYHNIVRNDLMRRVIHPEIYAAYSSEVPPLMDQSHGEDDWRIPLEFSHGAFRFGHAMVRPEYRINDLSTHDLNNTLEKTSTNDPVNMPLDETWMVQWSRFFEIRGSRPNFSRRIGPYLSDALGHDQIFSSFDETDRVGLLYRDLLGASLAGLWSVDALVAEIAARRPHFVNPSRLLSDQTYRKSQLREWLAAAPAYGALRPEDIDTLASDPPLPFFVLFEAMQEPQEGFCLGRLGSIIVSEVVFAALAGARGSLGCEHDALTDQLAHFSRRYYVRNVFSEIPEIQSMAQLVEFTAGIAGLEHAVPAFL